MRFHARRQRFRAILAGPACIRPASVYDPLSARMAETLGFPMMMLAGSTASLVLLGAPDLVLVTMDEFAGLAARICRAGELPLLVDADHGFGGALHAARTVEALEAAGVAGLTLEDTELPPAYGSAGPRLIGHAEAQGKIAAAVAARRDPDLVVVGRTSALTVTGTEDCVARLKLFAAAGADALFLPAIASIEQLEAVSAATGLPLIAGALGPGLDDPVLLERHRLRVCLQGHLPLQASIAAAHSALSALRDGVPPASRGAAALPDEVLARLTRRDDYARMARDYMGQPEKK